MEAYMDEEPAASMYDDVTTVMTGAEDIALRWKPAKFQSFETIALTSTKLNPSVRPCGFKSNGRNR